MLCSHRIGVIESFKSIQHGLNHFAEALMRDAFLPAHMEPLPYPSLQTPSPRESCLKLIQQLTYLDDQEGREILIGIGLIGCSEQTLAAAQALNQAKTQFKIAVQALKAQKLSLHDDWLKEAFISLFEAFRHEYTAMALQAAGLSRLHLKQCYRQIPLLSDKPMKVSWSWANTRSIKKITKADAISLLRKKGDDLGIARQVEQVEAMRPGECLAIVQDLAPHLRTNIVYATTDPNHKLMMKGSLPLLYPAQRGEALPLLILPKKKKKSERQKRSDVKIEPEVFLPAIRAHRYQQKSA